jgi:hypothetical protein
MSRRSDQPTTAARRALVAFQIFLVLATLLAPIPVAAEDPTADPSASAPAATEPAATPDPTPDPTEEPSATPTEEPPAPPTEEPTAPPTEEPAAPPPAEEPSAAPTDPPSTAPSEEPSPTAEPTNEPTLEPSSEPSSDPTTEPATPEPSSPAPTEQPSAPVAAPTIKSDLEDYPPGGLVTLTGTNWQPGESVHIFVNDDWGSSWSRNVDVIADESGNITDQFNLPNWFVAQYSVVATGTVSGTSRSSFTDSNPSAVSVASPTSFTVTQGGTAVYGNITVAATGSAAACDTILTLIGGSGLTGPPANITVNYGANPVRTTGNSVSTTFTISTSASTPTGTFTFQVSGTDSTPSTPPGSNCQGSASNAPSSTITLIVNPKANQATLSITAPTSATYGDPDATITTTGGSGSGALSFDAGSSSACSIVSGKLHVLSGTGTCSITATKAGDADYNPTTSAAFTVSINKATLTVDADDKTRDYGDPDPAFTATISGFKNGENLATSGVTGSPSCTTTATATTPVGTAPITCTAGTLAATNYDFTFTGGTLTIETATPTIVVTGYDVPWDGDPHTATGTATGVFGESLSGLDLSGTTHTAIGSYSDTWTFTDVTGNYDGASGSVTDKISTGFKIIGFFSPVDMTTNPADRQYNSVKGGQTVPLKFRIYRVSGTEVTSIAGVGVAATQTNCAPGDLDTTLLPDATGGTSLRYADGQFIFNWAVPKGAGKCYQVWVKSADGWTQMFSSFTSATEQKAYFRSK